ncbi:MAG TPA: hypothetical protein QF509_06900, partial [Rhodospirillales bacterium]|nr:hypothetical protein [Rhodospirillales bacterium]
RVCQDIAHLGADYVFIQHFLTDFSQIAFQVHTNHTQIASSLEWVFLRWRLISQCLLLAEVVE